MIRPREPGSRGARRSSFNSTSEFARRKRPGAALCSFSAIPRRTYVRVRPLLSALNVSKGNEADQLRPEDGVLAERLWLRKLIYIESGPCARVSHFTGHFSRRASDTALRLVRPNRANSRHIETVCPRAGRFRELIPRSSVTSSRYCPYARRAPIRLGRPPPTNLLVDRRLAREDVATRRPRPPAGGNWRRAAAPTDRNARPSGK